MNFVHVELPRAKITNDVHILHELLEWSVFGFEFFKIALSIGDDRVTLAKLFIAEGWMVKLNIGGCWNLMKMFDWIEQIGCYLSSCTLSAQYSFPYAFRAKLTDVSSWIIWSIRLLVEWFIDCHHFLLVAFEKVCTRCPFWGQLGIFADVKTRLNIQN